MKEDKKNNELNKALMIVEDFDLIRNLIGRHFLKSGFELISAGNVQEAVTIGIRDQPSIVIIDFDMSNDSYLVASILHNILPLSQIIIVNGRSQHCNSVEASVAGVDRIIDRADNPLILKEIIFEAAV
jgi:ActR/RegA family two-component response regulator